MRPAIARAEGKLEPEKAARVHLTPTTTGVHPCAPRPARPAALCIGCTDKLEITSRLGRGAFAVVYKGKMGVREVAVKVLTTPDDLNSQPNEAAKLAYNLFCREAKVLKTLGHHACVPAIFG